MLLMSNMLSSLIAALYPMSPAALCSIPGLNCSSWSYPAADDSVPCPGAKRETFALCRIVPKLWAFG